MTPLKTQGENTIANLLNFEEAGKSTNKKTAAEYKEIDKKFRQLVREKMEETIFKMIDLFVDVDDATSNRVLSQKLW